MNEEQRIFEGVLFKPGAPELRAAKLRCHDLCARYNRTFEEESELRAQLLGDIVGEMGEGGFIQGPVQFHYGRHTRIGKRFFGNFNLTVQDDALVTIGDDVSFGPNVTIVTPMHPLRAEERRQMRDENGQPARMCYALPVTIGNDVWLCANVVVCGGVTIGDGCVIGAGSVVTRDIPAGMLAAGNPCRVIRPITEADSMQNRPELLGGASVL